MPAITVRLTGLDDALEAIAQIPALLATAFAAAAARLSDDGTRYWRSLVTKRTGRMAASLHVIVTGRGLAITIHYVVGRDGFYYLFQREARSWNDALANYLAGRAQQVVTEEIRRRI